MMNFIEFTENVNDEFSIKKRAIDTQISNQKKHLANLKRQKLKIRYDKYDKARKDLQNKMNVFVNGGSNYE